MKSEIRLEFQQRQDKLDKPYFICKPRLPANVDLRDAVILFWPNDENGPTMVIGLSQDAQGAPHQGPRDRDQRGRGPRTYGDDDDRDRD